MIASYILSFVQQIILLSVQCLSLIIQRRNIALFKSLCDKNKKAKRKIERKKSDLKVVYLVFRSSRTGMKVLKAFYF